MLNGYRIHINATKNVAFYLKKKKKALKFASEKVTVWRGIIFELLWSGEEGELHEMRKSGMDVNGCSRQRCGKIT